MKKIIWYARDRRDIVGFPCRLGKEEPTFEEKLFFYDGWTGRYGVKEFKALFGFTPRPGEKGRLEIKRIKNKVK